MTFDPAPRHRWSFSLRTLFVGVLIAAALGWITLQFKVAIDRDNAWTRLVDELAAGYSPRPGVVENSPWLVTLLFGPEPAYDFTVSRATPAELGELRRLFPASRFAVRKDPPAAQAERS